MSNPVCSKYEFHVHPGASPSDIRLAYDGADGLAIGKSGGLQIATPLGTLEDSVPLSYQDIDGVRVPGGEPLRVGRHADAKGRFSFEVGGYQRDHELIIDPGVQYTTFLGGTSAETAVGIAVDSAGNAYVAGTTQSPNFPTTTGAFDRTGAAQNFADVFVTKLNPAGTALVYSTFVGGSNMEFGQGMALDGSGNVVRHRADEVVELPDHRRRVRPEPQHPGELPPLRDRQHRQLRLQAQRGRLGADVLDVPRRHRLRRRPRHRRRRDPAMPTWRARRCQATSRPRRARSTGREAASTTCSSPSSTHRLGARLLDVHRRRGRRQRRAGDGRQRRQRVCAGLHELRPTSRPPRARSTPPPTAAFDGTLTKLNPAGSALVYSTYFGGNDFDGGAGLVVDGAGNAYVAGSTPSANFPTTAGAYDTTFNNGDAFLTKFNAAGSALVFSTLVGGSDFDSFSAVVLDAAGNAWLTGGTSSADFP